MNLSRIARLGMIATLAVAASGLALALPIAPGNLTARGVSASRVDLTWSDLSSDEDGFQVFSAVSASGPWYEAGKTDANTTSLSVTGLDPSITYYFAVRASDADGASRFSNVASATTLSGAPLGPPTAVAAAPTSVSVIHLTWAAATGNPTGYQVFRGSSSSGPWYQLAITTPGATSFDSTDLLPGTTYYYTVRSLNSDGFSSFSAVVAATTLRQAIPSAPTNAYAATVSSTQVNVFWADKSLDEIGFKLERATAAGGPWTQITVLGPGEDSFIDTHVTPMTTYYYRVRAYGQGGDSAYSNIASVTTLADPTPETAPSNLTASAASASRIDLAWTDNSTNEGGFKVERYGPSGWAEIASVTGASYSDTGLVASTTYYYRVRAFSGTGVSSYSNIATATTRQPAPAAPSGLTARATSATQIDLSWTDHSTNETSFRIERSTGATGPFTQIATTAGTTYTDAGLAPSTIYYYRVRATNNGGNSGFSNTATATTQSSVSIPDAPTGLSATGATSSEIDLTWTDASSDELGFRIERAPAAAGPFTQIAVVPAGATGYADTSLRASTTYYYRVLSYNGAGASTYSNTGSATTKAATQLAPASPSGLSAAAVSPTQINLQWVDNASNETGFKIERATAAAGPFTQIATRAANALSYSDTTLSATTSYWYRVRAYNSGGNSSYTAVANATTQASTESVAPSVPGEPSVIAPGCGRISLSWGSSSDTGGSGLKGYNIYRNNTFLKQVVAPATSVSDTGLTSGSFYYYAISAVDNAGNQSAKTPIAGTYAQSCTGSGGDYIWARSFGGPDVYDSGYAVTVDRSGSVFVTGEFQDSADFGGGSRDSVGYRDIFVAKYSASGTYLWSKTFGGPYDDSGKSIAVDINGDVYLTGIFLQTATIIDKSVTSAGGYDIFMAKLSGLDGSRIWSKRIGGTGDDRAEGLALDSRGNIYVAGQFKGAVDFGGGAVPATSPYAQAFLAKYSGVDGAPLWAKRFGELDTGAVTTFGSSQGVVVDGGDNAIVTGYFRGPADFGGGPLDTAGGLDVFVAKFSSSGTHLWSESFGDPSDQHGMAIAVDSSSNIYLAGDFLGTADFGGGPLADTENAQTIFLASLSPDGHHRWSKSFPAAGLTSGSFAYDVAVTRADEVVLTGALAGTLDFGGGALPPAGPIFLAKFTQAGTSLWSKSFFGSGGRGRQIATDPDGSIYLAGSFEVNVDFGDGEIRSNGSSLTDGFILKIAK